MSGQTPEESNSSSLLDGYEDKLIQEHEYDGIQEYDNPMPGWWVWLFIATIAWSVVYVAGINLGYINTYDEDLAEGQQELIALRDQNQKDKPQVNAQLLAAAADDSEKVSQGEKVFKQSCASCHGQKGEGMIGPNLTDEHWIHGGSKMDVYKTVAEGVTANGMPAWEGVVTQEELIAVVAYIDSIQGTNPPGAKEPEGEKFEGDL